MEQVNTGATIPKTNTFSSASPMSQPSTHPSAMSQQKQNSLFEVMGPGYPAVIQEASQMVGSLKTAVELNPEFDLEVCQTGQTSKEPRTISMVYCSWGDTSTFQAPGLGSISEFCVTDSGSQDGVKNCIGALELANTGSFCLRTGFFNILRV